jgi:putative lipoprotein
MRLSQFVAFLAVVFLAFGLSPALAAKVALTGEITYRERIALPENATLRIRLVDMTAAAAPARVEAEGAIASPGEVPLSFTLNFDDEVLDSAHQYAIVAEISAGAELWFRNAAPYGLDPINPAQPVLVVVNFVGRLAEQSDNQAVTASTNAAAPTILETTWRADAIDGNPTSDDVDSTLSIATDLRAGGKGGCNNYFAQAELGTDTIAFSAVAATQMACASTLKTVQEEQFFAALAAARHWQMDGDDLRLMDADGGELVRFSRFVR